MFYLEPRAVNAYCEVMIHSDELSSRGVDFKFSRKRKIMTSCLVVTKLVSTDGKVYDTRPQTLINYHKIVLSNRFE